MANKAEFKVSFDLYNEDAVRKLQEEDPDLLPDYAVNSAKDLAYNKQQVNSAIESGILNGKSIDKIAEDLQDRMENANEQSAIKTARTAMTSAQNAGNLDSFYKAQEMGIAIEKQWVCTHDDRTRESHLELDGEHVPIDEEFSNGLQYPGDPNGDPSEVYNCRCTMVAYFPSTEESLSDEIGELKSEESESEDEYDAWLKKKNSEEIAAGRVNNSVSEEAKNYGADYRQVYQYITQPTEEQIIKKLAGRDKTKGSCASQALAYCGQKAGYDVRDYRGGLSRDYFRKKKVIRNIAKYDGVESISENVGNDLISAKNILNKLETDKEYYLSCGHHAAIVIRNEQGESYYLELQRLRITRKNGWKKIDDTVLKDRFVCNPKKSIGAFAVKVESLKNCDEFKDILGYINTN